MTALELSRQDARRISVRAQLLTAPQPEDLLTVVRQLGAIQADPTAAVAPSAELVAWSRLGDQYRLGDLGEALTAGLLVEFRGMIRPAEDLALFQAEMQLWRRPDELTGWQRAAASWVMANDLCRRDILARLFDEGPLTSRALPDLTEVPWQSSGWNNGRNVRMMLELLERRGEVATAGYDGRDRLWDLAERIFPEQPTVPLFEAARIRDERRLRSLGIARPSGPECPVEPNDVGAAGIEARIDGVRGSWRVDPAQLDATPGESRTVLLSPLDRLVYDRKRMADVFDWDYQLEMYKPAAKRRWGYWAMPILHGDELIGKLDATADPRSGRLFADAVHEDGSWTAALRHDVDREIHELADWLGLRLERRSRRPASSALSV